MNPQAFLCAIFYFSLLAVGTWSQEEGSCEVLFQTQPLSDLRCNPYIGSRNRLSLQCNVILPINVSFTVKWYHSAHTSSGEAEDLSAVRSSGYIIRTPVHREDEFKNRAVNLIRSVLIITNLTTKDAGQYWCVVFMGDSEITEFSPCTKTTLLTPEESDGLALCPLASLYDPTPVCVHPHAGCPMTTDVEIPNKDTSLSSTGRPNMTTCVETIPGDSSTPIWSFFILAVVCIAFLIVTVAIATYITAKKTKSLRNERESPKSSPAVTVQYTTPVRRMPEVSLSSAPVLIPSNPKTNRDLQAGSTSLFDSVKSDSSLDNVAEIVLDRPTAPQQKKCLPQDSHNGISLVGGRHARVADSHPAVSCPVGVQKQNPVAKPTVPRRKKLPDIISNNIATADAQEGRYSVENSTVPGKGPSAPRLGMSSHPCNNQESIPETNGTKGHSVSKRHAGGVVSARRKPPPIPQKKKKPSPVVRDDPDYVNTASLPCPPDDHFQPPTVVRDGQEYHILSQTPPQSKEGDPLHDMYTPIVNRYQISTIEEFPTELEEIRHCYENEEVFPIRYQPLTRQTLESSAEYCSTDIDYLNVQASNPPRPHHRHWS